MIAYLDASVILRVLLGQRNQLQQWSEISWGVTSELSRVECLRTLDRMRVNGLLGEEQDLTLREATFGIYESLEIVEVFPAILERASSPLPMVLGTLDAIHLCTALLWRNHSSRDLVLATHDRALTRAATALGLHAIGVP